MSARAIAVLVMAASAIACRRSNDLGSTCSMTTSCDGGTCAVAASRVADPSLDYMALGVSECDDQICLRTRGSENPPTQDGLAYGYCSAGCLDDSDCKPSAAAPAMTCQRLLNVSTFADSDLPPGADAKYCSRARTP